MVSVIGLLGAVLLPVAWLAHSYRAYEAGGLEAADVKSSGLYAVSSLLLLYHALQLQDLPFVLLTLSLALFTSTETALIIHARN